MASHRSQSTSPGGYAKQEWREADRSAERSVNGIAEAKGVKEDSRLVRACEFSRDAIRRSKTHASVQTRGDKVSIERFPISRFETHVCHSARTSRGRFVQGATSAGAQNTGYDSALRASFAGESERRSVDSRARPPSDITKLSQ